MKINKSLEIYLVCRWSETELGEMNYGMNHSSNDLTESKECDNSA